MSSSQLWRLAGPLALAVTLLAACGGPSVTESLAAAKAHMQSRQFASAVIELKNAIGKEPSQPEIRYLLGVTLREVGQLNQALIEFRKAQELGYDANVLVPQIVSTLLQSGAAKEALAEIESAKVTQAAARSELDYLRGEAHFFSGATGAARQSYQAAFSGEVDHPLARARVATLDKDYGAALIFVDKALVDRPFDVGARILKARILSTQGRRDTAADVFEATMRDSPGDTRGYTLGVPALIDAKQLDRAAKAVEAFKKSFPGAPLAQYLNAQVLHGRGENSQARDAMLQVVKAFPDDYSVHYLFGSIEYTLQNDVSAERHLARALVMSPDDTRIRQMLASTYVRLSRYADARTVLKPLLDDSSPSAETLALAGNVAFGGRDYKGAEAYLLRALSAQPKDAAMLFQLGRARLRMGRVAEALQNVNDAIALDPKLVAADALLVEHYASKREAEKAVQTAQRAVGRAPEMPETHNMLGLALLSQNDRTAARKAFEKALEVSGTFIPALQNLTRLDVKEKRVSAAEARLKELYAKHPRNEPLAFQYATFLAQKTGESAPALGILDEIITQNPASVRIRLLKIDKLMKAGDSRGAVDAAEAAEAILPGDPGILFALARAQQANRNFAAARTTYGKLAVSMKQSPAPHLGLAEVYAAEKNWADARSSILKAIDADSEGLSARVALVNLDIQSGRLDLARQSALAIQSKWPRLAEGFVVEGKVLVAQKAFDTAETVLRRGVEASEDPALVARLYAFLLERGKGDAADAFVSEWFAKRSPDVRILISAGDSRLARGDFPAAEKWYRKALPAAQKIPGVLNNLALALGKQRNPDALSIIERALALSPGDPSILDTAGWIHTELGDAGKAVDYLTEASAARPDDTSIRLNLVRALSKAGNSAKAREELVRVTQGLTTASQKSEIARLRAELGG